MAMNIAGEFRAHQALAVSYPTSSRLFGLPFFFIGCYNAHSATSSGTAYLRSKTHYTLTSKNARFIATDSSEQKASFWMDVT